jgi:hypothetical protein
MSESKFLKEKHTSTKYPRVVQTNFVLIFGQEQEVKYENKVKIQDWAEFLVEKTAISESFILSYAQQLANFCPLNEINSLSDISFDFVELPVHRKEVESALTKHLENKKSLFSYGVGSITKSLVKLALSAHKYNKLESIMSKLHYNLC